MIPIAASVTKKHRGAISLLAHITLMACYVTVRVRAVVKQPWGRRQCRRHVRQNFCGGHFFFMLLAEKVFKDSVLFGQHAEVRGEGGAQDCEAG